MCLKRRHPIAIAVAVIVGGGVFAGSAVSAAHLSASKKPIGVPAMGRIIPQRLPPFIAYDDGNGIALMKPDGTDSHEVGPSLLLTPDALAGTATEPSWSPRGSRILYSMGCLIWVMNADGSNQLPLIATGADCEYGGPGEPRWGPRGRRIVYTSGFGPTIHIANADGSQAHRVPHTQGHTTPPSRPMAATSFSRLIGPAHSRTTST